jgi:predicted membrane protein
MMNLQWYDWVGMAGTALVVAAFFLLQAGRLDGNRLTYQLMNLFGAAGILVSLWGSFNISVFLLEATWVAISVYGIARSFKAKRTGPR